MSTTDASGLPHEHKTEAVASPALPQDNEQLRAKISKTCEGIGAGLMGEDGIDHIMELVAAEQTRLKAEAESTAIDVLAKAQLNMRPLIALKNGNGEPDGKWYVMYFDEDEQLWNRARYGDIVKEVKSELIAKLRESLPEKWILKQEDWHKYATQYQEHDKVIDQVSATLDTLERGA